MVPNAKIINRVNILKKKLWLSDEELARASGYKYRTIGQWRAGVGTFPADAIMSWAIAYNVSADWLLGITKEGEPKQRKKPLSHGTVMIERIVTYDD